MAKQQTSQELHDEVTALRMELINRQVHERSGGAVDNDGIMRQRLQNEKDNLKAQLAQMDEAEAAAFPPSLEEHAARIAAETAKLAKKGEVTDPGTTVLPVDPMVAEVPQSNKGK
jgi:hypothetical protein